MTERREAPVIPVCFLLEVSLQSSGPFSVMKEKNAEADEKQYDVSRWPGCYFGHKDGFKDTFTQLTGDICL